MESELAFLNVQIVAFGVMFGVLMAWILRWAWRCVLRFGMFSARTIIMFLVTKFRSFQAKSVSNKNS